MVVYWIILIAPGCTDMVQSSHLFNHLAPTCTVISHSGRLLNDLALDCTAMSYSGPIHSPALPYHILVAYWITWPPSALSCHILAAYWMTCNSDCTGHSFNPLATNCTVMSHFGRLLNNLAPDCKAISHSGCLLNHMLAGRTNIWHTGCLLNQMAPDCRPCYIVTDDWISWTLVQHPYSIMTLVQSLRPGKKAYWCSRYFLCYMDGSRLAYRDGTGSSGII